FFNDTATTEIYTLSLHDALPICAAVPRQGSARALSRPDRHRCLSAAADGGNRGHLLGPHLRHDAEGRDAGEYRARQACRERRPDRRPRFGAALPCRAGCTVARAAAARKPAVAPSQGYGDAARRAAADRRPARDPGDGKHQEPAVGRQAAAAGRRQSRLLSRYCRWKNAECSPPSGGRAAMCWVTWELAEPLPATISMT